MSCRSEDHAQPRRCGALSARHGLATAGVLALVLSLAQRTIGAEVAAAAPTGQITILSSDSCLRGYLVFRTPVKIATDEQIEVCQEKAGKEIRPVPDFQSPLPPAGWTGPDFDDAMWDLQRAPVERGPGDFLSGTKYAAAGNSAICLRGRFSVPDPANAPDLSLDVVYVGGVVVYVNGQEVTRKHLQSGELKPDALAEKYPDDLYCPAGGKYLTDPSKDREGFERRYRRLTAVAVPSKLLRKGTNVLALELRRAPVNGAAAALPVNLWASVGLKSFSLTAPAGSAVVPNVARPKDIQVWNCPPDATVTAWDCGDGASEVRPITISSPRNGVFSGRLVVGSDEALTGLKVSVSELVRSGGKEILRADAVRMRCAAPAVAGKSSVGAGRFDGLDDVLPADIPVSNARPPAGSYLHYENSYDKGQPIERKALTAGALAPLWLTVRVPRDTVAGTYQGMVLIEATGLKRAAVPLRVEVSAWTLPAPRDFRMHNFAYHSSDSLAKHYEVEMWSDRHFELMGKSLALMSEVNSRQAIINLCINFYGGNKGAVDCSNEDTLVRWIKQPDGSFKYDFTLFDKYLDTVAKAIGKPSLLRLNCWNEVSLKDGKLIAGSPTGSFPNNYPVTLLDPATGKTEPLVQPTPGTEESYAFWKPVLDEVRKKIEARGWWDVTALGHNSYCYPPHAKVMEMAKRIWPDGAWSYTAHNGALGQSWGGLPCRYADAVWSAGAPKPRGYRELLKTRPTYWCFTWRSWMRDFSPLTLLRNVPEDELMKGHDGVSDFGADVFPVKAQSGRFHFVGCGRGTGGPTCSTLAMLSPGADGPVATERFEMLREGVELGEAILFLEKALQDKKISGDLEQRVNKLLDARGEAYFRYPGGDGGRFERDARLIALAGEVAAVDGQK